MRWIFATIADRLRALFVADLALEFESEAFAREADHKAELLRQAASYRDEGLATLADELEARAAEVDLRQPLAGILAAIQHWQGNKGTDQPSPGQKRRRLPASRSKKKARRQTG